MQDQHPAPDPGRPPDTTGGQPTHSEDGADLTLIRWMLSLTPAERLEVLQQSVESILSLRDANPGLGSRASGKEERE